MIFGIPLVLLVALIGLATSVITTAPYFINIIVFHQKGDKHAIIQLAEYYVDADGNLQLSTPNQIDPLKNQQFFSVPWESIKQYAPEGRQE